MNSAIAAFFASLISGALSFADFRPALSDMVQILTGVQITQQTTLEPHQVKDCSTEVRSKENHLYISSDTTTDEEARCNETAYEQGPIYIL
ncbi:hypothetical protein [uncultured Pontibacter sp.]|uniref:hypothetical protein n=1 Tax=uncultured Pontibacter sp. TaxID=453356 RepID=UPI00263A1A6E|nr:hypothetical protein [uncultured Pontibacter sp.]